MDRWFHIIAHTYGSWLHGDARAFRTRYHREHVEGDYKNPPPPQLHEHERQRSLDLLQQAPVVLQPEWRPIVGAAIRDKLQTLGAQVLCVRMSANHLHLLAKMPDGNIPRLWVGQAKHATFLGKAQGWTAKLWAVRCKVGPVEDRKHQVNVLYYILAHKREGAWTWSFRESPGMAIPGETPQS